MEKIPNRENPIETERLIKEKFKESKVVDENGELLTVYHFSDDNITEFSTGHTGKNYFGDKGFFGEGIYFTDSEDAFTYGSKRYSAYLNLKNPLIVKNPSTEDVKQLHGKKIELIEQGYDGVMVWNDASEDKLVETGKMKGGIIKGIKAGWSEICVFNPEDIYKLK